MTRVALVTGASRPKGLGQAIATRLAADGCDILLHDRGALDGDIAPAHGVGVAQDLEATAQMIRDATGQRIETVAGNLLDSEAIRDIISAADDRFGRLDVLVNNAGVGYLFGPLTETDPVHLDAVLGVNLRAPMLLTGQAAKLMIRGGKGGRVINIASQAAKSGFAFASAYTASKHGLLGFTRSAALELGQHGITVNAVCPNHVTTGLGAWQNDFMSKARGETLEQYMDGMRARIPLGRTGLPEDTANAVAFLCSDQASYVTGEAMNVSGGEEYH
jgi:meso-butanediol dehydrogenase/(S,S)-butanediol dehydrogenase/diacetyl reductase